MNKLTRKKLAVAIFSAAFLIPVADALQTNNRDW